MSQLAARLRTYSHQFQQREHDLRSHTDRMEYEGPAASRFRVAVNGELSRGSGSIRSTLSEVARLLDQEAGSVDRAQRTWDRADAERKRKR